jgi:riboflavin kinase/FMN adenylyltransferase
LKVYYSLSDFQALNNAIVTTGTFDGVHVGHRKILSQLNAVAKKHAGESVLLTFFPHPRMVLQPDLELKLINSQNEKIELLKSTGLDHLIIHPFSIEFSRTSSVDFVRNILVNKIGAKKLVIGYDHHFGRNREGSFEHLKEYGPVYGFHVEEISAQDVADTTVSSTKIREAIRIGTIETANQYLQYKFPLFGKVVSGEKIGHTLGYPTANIQLEDSYKIIPANGVYAVRVEFPHNDDAPKWGICNIGMRPTFGGKFQTIEVHLLDFEGNLYGQNLNLRFYKRLRQELKFDGLEALKQQLQKDEQEARTYFSSL